MPLPPVALADLSQFTVVSVECSADTIRLTGKVSLPAQHAPGVACCLAFDHQFFPEVKFVTLDVQTGAAVISLHSAELPDEVNATEAFPAGTRWPLFSRFWDSPVRVVLDRSQGWQAVRFEPRAAFVEEPNEEGWRMSRPLQPGDEARTDGHIDPGGWDHEHCELCWGHIEVGESSEAFRREHQWVCPQCYEAFVAPPDLRFVVEGLTPPDKYTPENIQYIALKRLIEAHDLPAIKSLLTLGHPVDPRGPDGTTPLIFAASRDLPAVIPILLDSGADVNATCRSGTALSIATEAGYRASTDLLIAAGAASTTGQVPPSD